MKNAINFILFSFIFLILFNVVFNVLWLEETSISDFYKEPKNSIDVIYLGGSNSFMHFNPTLAYNEYGFTTAFLTTGSHPIVCLKYLIKEAQKYQNPKLYVITLTEFGYDINLMDESDGNLRRVTDSLKFSKNKLELLNVALNYKKKFNESKLDYYFSYFLYHNKWKNVFDGTANRYLGVFYKGFWFNEDSLKTVNINSNTNNKIEELPKENKEILDDLLNYIKSEKLNVLFVIPERNYHDYAIKRLNYVENYLKEKNFKVINFKNSKELGINYQTDFKDGAHFNINGVTKYTLYFSKYLKENYNLDDHRNIYIYITHGIKNMKDLNKII